MTIHLSLKTNELSLMANRGIPQVQRAGGGLHPVTYFAEEGVFFKTSACPRFCKRRVLFCTQVRGMEDEIPLKKYTRL